VDVDTAEYAVGVTTIRRGVGEGTLEWGELLVGRGVCL
jgi:hypothetical protein